ncbi:MAG: c-type cytochrome, partial [Candidatus Binatia bacterium]
LTKMKSRYPQDPAAIDAGSAIYRRRCAGCHGDEGRGDGGGAAYFDPRPRDFTKGLFKFRSTKSGELPTDEDLFRTVSRGVPGTAMPAWGEGPFQLSVRERWQVVYYVKQLGGEDFADPDFNPYEQILPQPEPPGETAQRIQAGREIFSDEQKGGCIKCHGPNGRGNGPEAGTQVDDWGDPILPADLTKGWRYKNGTTPEEIFRTLSTGLNGTPMPGYGETLTAGERWSLAYFVHSLIEPHEQAGDRVLVARQRDSIPSDPQDRTWLAIPGIDVPLLGQVVRRPRHPNAAVDLVVIRALYNAEEIAFHLTWNDRTRSVTHEATPIASLQDTYVPTSVLWKRRGQRLRDSLQMQFPARALSGPELPYFYLGGGVGGPVTLWRWFADREASGEGRAFEERLQNGAEKPSDPRPDQEQALAGLSHYEDGRWTLVIRRRHPAGRKRDVTFAAGAFVPFALQVWDGGNGEEGPLCSISSWYWLRLEAPTPPAAYLAAVAGFGGTQIFMLILVVSARRAGRKERFLRQPVRRSPAETERQ